MKKYQIKIGGARQFSTYGYYVTADTIKEALELIDKYGQTKEYDIVDMKLIKDVNDLQNDATTKFRVLPYIGNPEEKGIWFPLGIMQIHCDKCRKISNIAIENGIKFYICKACGNRKEINS